MRGPLPRLQRRRAASLVGASGPDAGRRRASHERDAAARSETLSELRRAPRTRGSRVLAQRDGLTAQSRTAEPNSHMRKGAQTGRPRTNVERRCHLSDNGHRLSMAKHSCPRCGENVPPVALGRISGGEPSPGSHGVLLERIRCSACGEELVRPCWVANGSGGREHTPLDRWHPADSSAGRLLATVGSRGPETPAARR